MNDDNQNKTPEQKIDEALTKLSYESLKLWLEKLRQESNPLRSGDDDTEGIP
jgi:hypothetical protein